MKTLDQMLHELVRPEVTEFALLSDRLPCVRVGDTYEPVDDRARSTEAILEILVRLGGSRYVDALETEPAKWTASVTGVGSVRVHAIMRGGRVQARFTIVKRAPAETVRAALSLPAPSTPRSGGALGAVSSPSGGRFEEVASIPAAGASFDAPNGRPGGRVGMVPPGMSTGDSFDARSSQPGDPQEPRTLSSMLHTALSRAAVDVTASPAPGPPLAPSPVDPILASARDEKASDVHIVAGRPVLLRLRGELVSRGSPVAPSAAEAMLVPLVPPRLRALLDGHGACDFALDRGEALGRFRVNVARQRTGYKGCFRRIPAEVPTLGSLGLPQEIARALAHHQGLVVITGPTGHGKTTTLAAVVDIINRDAAHHVVTVEDPVEFVHTCKRALISQREVGTHTASFQSALKAALREDPDVIVVGELRDTETVRMALAASETGHLVLGTMNTPSAAKTIDRIIDLFPPADQGQVRMTLAGGLHLVVSQRLLPAAEGRGMVAAVELLPGSIALWNLIREGKTYQIPSVQQRGRAHGVVRLDDSLAELVKSGRVTREIALANAENPDELEAVLAGKRMVAPMLSRPAPAPESAGILGLAGQILGKRGP
ncbi:MAG: PilT/PilU family type 4a pilus ATPase [Polyangiaceae bacterium]|jgi:twitching motility protein PilT